MENIENENDLHETPPAEQETPPTEQDTIPQQLNEYAQALQELNDKMSAILVENEKMKELLNNQFQLSDPTPPPPEAPDGQLTYGQLAEQLVNDPNSITSRFMENYTRK